MQVFRVRNVSQSTKYFIMSKDYDKQSESFFYVIPSPEYNNTIEEYVVDSTVKHNNFTYKVTNEENTTQKVRIVLFPDGTAEVLKTKK